MLKKYVILFFLALSLSGLTGCASQNFLHNPFSMGSATAPVSNQSLADNSPLWQMNTATIWNKLQHTSLSELQTRFAQSREPTVTGWLKLAIISKQYSTNSTQLVNQLLTWGQDYSNHAGNTLLPDDATLTSLASLSPPKHIALLLPLQNQFAAQGQAVRDGFLGAYYSSLAKQNAQQTVSFYDTSKTTNMSALYQQALSEGADLIIGPLLKENVQALAQQGNFPVPTIELNYTDLWFGSLPTNLYQFGLSPQDEAQQAANKARQAGLSRAIVIAPNDEWGQRVAKALTAEWQSLGGSVIDTLYFSSET